MFKKNKFNIDLKWNMISFIVSAIMGLLLNILIVKFRGYEKLGLFNQAYAWYMIISQIAVFGIHLSIQNIIPITEKIVEKKNQLVAALLLCLLTSIPVFLVTKIILLNFELFDHEEQIRIIYTLPAIIFFAFNKILLSYLNGDRQMISYAVFNAFRFIFLVIYVIVLIIIDESVLHIFLLSELSLFVFLIIKLRNYFTQIRYNLIITYIKSHYNFGKNVFWGNLLLDVNSRVDIIVLGVFFPNNIVGIYSFASLFNDGFLQILIVVRNNINPIITKIYFQKSPQLLAKVIKTTVHKSYKNFTIFGIFLILIFPIGLYFIHLMENWLQVWLIFTLLILTSITSSGYYTLFNIFSQISQPKKQSHFYLYLFLINLIADFIFIPLIGMCGAIVGIFLSYVWSIFYLQKLVKSFKL